MSTPANGPFTAKFTSFATYKDLVGYINCLLAGGSENGCYKKGDNGTGASGKRTAQTSTPMCALPKKAIVDRWGSTRAGWGKNVECSFAGHKIVCEVADIAPAGVCDLNPASLIEAGLDDETELNVQGTWRWL